MLRFSLRKRNTVYRIFKGYNGWPWWLAYSLYRFFHGQIRVWRLTWEGLFDLAIGYRHTPGHGRLALDLGPISFLFGKRRDTEPLIQSVVVELGGEEIKKRTPEEMQERYNNFGLVPRYSEGLPVGQGLPTSVQILYGNYD